MTDRMNPTDQATPLTQEAERFAHAIDTHWPLDSVREQLRAIEAAAARRAIEGSGVVNVEALAKALHAIGMGCWSPRGPGGALCKEVTEGNPLNDLHTPTAARLLAALPRPEEPRVDRCAWVFSDGLECGDLRESTLHRHIKDDETICAEYGGHPRPECHPFTQEAR